MSGLITKESYTDRLLSIGLERWRQHRLVELEEELSEHQCDFRAAQDSLAIVRDHPGQISQDVIEIVWDTLGDSAERFAMVEALHQEVMQMDTPHLLIAFQRKEKPQWAFQR